MLLNPSDILNVKTMLNICLDDSDQLSCSYSAQAVDKKIKSYQQSINCLPLVWSHRHLRCLCCWRKQIKISCSYNLSIARFDLTPDHSHQTCYLTNSVKYLLLGMIKVLRITGVLFRWSHSSEEAQHCPRTNPSFISTHNSTQPSIGVYPVLIIQTNQLIIFSCLMFTSKESTKQASKYANSMPCESPSLSDKPGKHHLFPHVSSQGVSVWSRDTSWPQASLDKTLTPMAH